MNSIKNKNVKNFISFVEKELKKFDGQLIIKHVILNKKGCSDGEFSEDGMKILCYYDPSSYYWVGVLAHEYAHFLQCKNEKKIWNEFIEKTSCIEDVEVIFQNQKKQKLNKRQRYSLINKILPIELNADKKAVFFIKKFSIPIDIRHYIKESNIILYKYLYWAEFGFWSRFKTNESINFRGAGLSKFKKLEEYKSISKMPKKIFFLLQSSEI